jgi:hypothetical protein
MELSLLQKMKTCSGTNQATYSGGTRDSCEVKNEWNTPVYLQGFIRMTLLLSFTILILVHFTALGADIQNICKILT